MTTVFVLFLVTVFFLTIFVINFLVSCFRDGIGIALGRVLWALLKLAIFLTIFASIAVGLLYFIFR